MSSTTTNPCSSTSGYIHPLIVDVVIDKILSHLGDDYQLLNYRLVCHKWNDIIVRKINKSGHSFHIPLRYGPKVPKLLFQSIARRSSNQSIDSVIRILKGTAAHLIFDTISIYSEFYLAAAEVLANWKRLLKIQGEFIRHLKFNTERVEPVHHVTDCDELFSPESLRVTFSEIPFLETLEFFIQFSNTGDQLLFRGGQIPPLLNLTKMTILEPHGFSYSTGFLNDIFSMSPNLSKLYIKSWGQLSKFSEALSSQCEPHLVTTLRVHGVTIRLPDIYENSVLFPEFKLTTLKVKDIHGEGSNYWVECLIKAHSSTLEKLTLGSRRDGLMRNKVRNLEVHFHPRRPVIMKSLKSLEINLSEFTYKLRSYKDEFPVLQILRIVVPVVDWDLHLHEFGSLSLTDGRVGPCNTIQQLSVVGVVGRTIQECCKNRVISSTRAIFPMAEYNFDS